MLCHKPRSAYLSFWSVSFLVCLALQAAGGPARAETFSLQCSEDERISRIVVRTGFNDQFQFLGIECQRPDGNRRIFKSGIERGTRHEIETPKEISEIRFTSGTCSGDSFTNFVRVCALSFRFADNTGTSDFGSNLLTGSHRTLNGNGEIYGVAGVFRQGQSDVESGYSDLKIVTRKLSASNDSIFDIAGVLDDIRSAMRGAMGYAAVIRNPEGERIGFVRAGWAIHPQDGNLGQHAGQFDVHTKAAVGSTTKPWATAVAALRVDEFTQADTLNTPFQQYLPRRWREELDPRFQGATVLDVIKHRAGFRRNGPSSAQTGGVFPARFRLQTGETWTNADNTGCSASAPNCNRLPTGSAAPYERRYSNTAGGLFHYILPHMMLASVSGAPTMEESLEGLSDDAYDAAITAFTGKFYEDFVQEHILAPVGAVANCNSSHFLGNEQVAAAYDDGQQDRTGVLPASSTGHCASGGWVISADDLTKVLSALAETNEILNAGSRGRLLNFGADRVWDVATGGHHTHDGLHDGLRAVVIVRNGGYVAALIYNSRQPDPLSPGQELRDQQLLVNAFNNNIR